MKVNVFTAADYAGLHGGGLVIVGAFDNIESKKCPFTFRPFYVALKIFPEKQEWGKTYKMHLILRKRKHRKAIAKLPISLYFKKVTAKKISSVSISVGLLGMRFDSFGTYVLEMKSSTTSKVFCYTKINVVKIPEKAKNKKS